MSLAHKPRLLLFIHGWRGTADEAYWARFPDLVRADTALAQNYDVAMFSYPTAATALGRSTPVPVAAQLLRTHLDTAWKDYAEVAIIAHSQGGLVTRRYLADRARDSQAHRVSRVIYFATPHLGALGGKLGRYNPLASDEWADLGYDSDMLQQLLIDEAATLSHLAVPAKFIVGQADWIVGITSAWGVGRPEDYVVLPGMDHGSLVRPDSEEHVSFVIARDFLLDKNASARLGAPTDHTQPFLKSKYWQQSAEDQVRNRFVYWNRELPLFGRDAEQSELNAFLEDPSRRFGWKLVLGSGGVGKSRIALELVLARRAEWWHAGFLDEQPPLEYWAKWQPARPTLIVIDYASRESIYVGKMLASLAEREPPFLLQHPVRALLLERNTIGPWLENILGASRLLLGSTTKAPDLTLGPLTDVWLIFEYILGAEATTHYTRSTILATLKRIDAEERPLFALLMADALKNGRDVRKWDQSALLLDVIDRDRRQFWLPCAGQLGMGTTLISIAREERALAIATMVGTTSDPLKRSEIEAHHHKLLPSWDVDRHPIFFSSIAGAKHHEAISPIEPDLIGEFFALNALSELSKDDTQDLVRLSWSMRAESMAYFIVRCAMDYPDHTLIPTLHTIEPWDTETAESWSLAAFYLIMLAIKDTRPLSVQATGLEQPSLLKLDKAEYLQAKIKRLATSYPSSFLRYVWGMAVANLLCLLASINRRLADDLCTELKEQSRRHPTEDKLRHLAAQGIAAHYGLLVLRIGVEEKDLRYLVDDLSDDETNLIQHYMMVRYAIAGM